MQRLRTVTSLDVSAVAGHHAMPAHHAMSAALLFESGKRITQQNKRDGLALSYAVPKT